MHTEMGNIMRNIPSIQMMDAMARGEARAEARIRENIIKAVHEGKIPLKAAKDIDLDVEKEMIERNISIPDQGAVEIEFEKSRQKLKQAGQLKEQLPETAETAEQSEPIEQSEQSEQSEPIEPIEPIEQSEPTEPSKLSESSNNISSNISAETAETAREKLAEESLAEESLAEGKLTEELLKFFTKEEVAVFFKRIKELNSESNVTPAQHIDYQLNRPIEDAEREKRYKSDYTYRRTVDKVQAEVRENFIRAVHEGKIGILMARYAEFDVEQEMIARGISIPDQDLLDIKFYKIRYENAILDKGIKELLKIFTRDEVVKYLEFVIRRDAVDADNNQ